MQLQSISRDVEDILPAITTRPNDIVPAPTVASVKSDSYTNLYDSIQDLPLGGSAHSLRNHLTVAQDPLSVGTAAVLKMKPTPPKMLYNNSHPLSQRGIMPRQPEGRAPVAVMEDYTPSPVDRYTPVDRYGRPATTAARNTVDVSPPSRDGGIRTLASDERYPTIQSGTSGDGRSWSESQRSPPQYGGSGRSGVVPMTKRTSPSSTPIRYGPVHSPTTSPPHAAALPGPTRSAAERYRTTAGAVSSVGATRSPLSSEVAGINNIPGSIRRPMSFVKALEMSDQLAVYEPESQRGKRHTSVARQMDATTEEDELAFGSSYEIAV